MAPRPFDSISQTDEEGRVLDMDEIVREENDGYLSKFNCCKYTYLSPKTKTIIGGTFLGLAAIIGIAAIATNTSSSNNNGSWPPPEVTSDYNIYKESKDGSGSSSINLALDLQVGKQYLQRTDMETSTSISLGRDSFAETMHMTTENTLNIAKWLSDDGAEVKGKTAEVKFTHLAVTTMDSEGDSTYYNSFAKDGDTDFDAVLETMIGESATVRKKRERRMDDDDDDIYMNMHMNILCI